MGNRGPVIPPHVLPALFQSNDQRTTGAAIKGRGSWGLGLTFCCLAIERHGGTIRALSPYVNGEGVAVEFVLRPDTM